MNEPKKVVTNKLNGDVLLGIVIIIMGLALGSLLFLHGYQKNINIIDIIFTGIIVIIFIVIGILNFVAAKKGKCHYCKREIKSYDSRINIEWSEATVPSKEEVRLGKVMHKDCHERAVLVDNDWKVPVNESFKI